MLPPELLLRIFAWLPDLAEESGTPACIAVSRVSRYWRQLALACPELWAVVLLQNSIWALRALELSQNLPAPFHVTPSKLNQHSPGRYFKPSFLAIRNLSRTKHAILGYLPISHTIFL